MKKTPQSIVSEYLSGLGKKGGRSRAKKYDKTTLSKWGKLGGRPRKNAKTKGKP